MELMPIAGGVVCILGALFLFLGALGTVRMPDVYNRIQAGTKATTLGTLLFLIGTGLYNPSWIPKLIIIGLFILLTNPVSSHILSRAAHRIGARMSDKTVVDKLKESEENVDV